MKLSIVSLKKNLLPENIENRAHSVEKTPTKLKNFFETLPINKPEKWFHKELQNLEKSLDIHEISLKNSIGTSVEPELKFYLSYLLELSSLLRHKDLNASKSFIRGVVGCERAVKKLIRQYSLKKNSKVISKTLTVENYSQTDSENSIKQINLHPMPDLESIKHLRDTCKKIKISRIATHLCDLYDSLSKMRIDVSEPISSPLLKDSESFTLEKIMELHLNVIKRNLSNIINHTSHYSVKTLADKACQDDFFQQEKTELKIVKTGLKDTTLEASDAMEKVNLAECEKQILEERISKLNFFYSQIEKQHNEVEIEAVKLKATNENLQRLALAFEKKVNWLENRLETNSDKMKKSNLRIDELKQIIIKKQQVTSNLNEEIYDLNISNKILEEKLAEIHNAWEKKCGRRFEHKEINLELLIERHKIEKKYETDEFERKAVEVTLSENSENGIPDFKEIEALKKSGSGLELFENLKKKTTVNGLKAIPEKIIPELQSKLKKEETLLSDEGSYVIKQEKRDTEKLKIDLKKSDQSKEKQVLNLKNSSLGRSIKHKPENSLNLEFAQEESKIESNYRDLKLISRLNSIENDLIQPELVDESSSIPNFEPLKKDDLETMKSHQLPYVKEMCKSKINSLSATTKIDSNQSFAEFDFDSGELKDVQRLERILKLSIKSTEDKLISSLEPDEIDLYKKYKQLTEELERIKKILNILMKSVETQCDATTFLSNGTRQRSLLNSSVDFSSKRLKESNRKGLDPFDTIRGNDDAYKLLSSVFENENYSLMLNFKEKMEIVRSLKGHQKSICKEMCPHLLRVLKIKWKVKGTSYPIRNILIKPLEEL